MHEMIAARHPFHGSTHYDTLRNMVSSPPKLDPRISVDATAVIKAFLIKNPNNRLCGKSGINELKSMTFFSSLDWDALYNKQIIMPYLPELNNPLDLSSFEAVFTREAAVDSVVADGDNDKGGDTPGGRKNKSRIMGLIFGGGGGGGQPTSGLSSQSDFENFAFEKNPTSTDGIIAKPPPASDVEQGSSLGSKPTAGSFSSSWSE